MHMLKYHQPNPMPEAKPLRPPSGAAACSHLPWHLMCRCCQPQSPTACIILVGERPLSFTTKHHTHPTPTLSDTPDSPGL